MAEKVILRSLTVDNHGDFVPLEMMETYANVINGHYKMRYLINHRRDIPPLGYFDNAEIKELNKIIHVIAEPLLFKNKSTVAFDKSLILEEPEKPISFITSEDIDKFQILLDKNNFENINVLQNTAKKLRQIFSEEISLELGMRKNLVPDPQVVITLVKYYFILYPLLKPFFAKIGEKIVDDVAEDIYDGCKKNAKSVVKKLTETVRIVRQHMIPKNKILHTIFEIPGTPKIELHIKSDDATKIEKGLQATKLFSIHKKVMSLQSQLDISEIHFIFNSKNKWEFSYLITNDGKVIGTKISFSKRDKLLSRIELSSTKAFSIGANGIEYERNSSRQI